MSPVALFCLKGVLIMSDDLENLKAIALILNVRDEVNHNLFSDIPKDVLEEALQIIEEHMANKE